MTTTRHTVRSFLVGFVLGAIAIAFTLSHDRVPSLTDQVFPAAVAAPVQ